RYWFSSSSLLSSWSLPPGYRLRPSPPTRRSSDLPVRAVGTHRPRYRQRLRSPDRLRRHSAPTGHHHAPQRGLKHHAGQYGTHPRSEEHTSELQSRENLVCRLLLEKKKYQDVSR